ncbi:hypothetical protein E2C01_052734 [Portunus trituberculatus]|uniref:Uncharacterized protein n=1 Tax=Portunus trituberculatus TaxID=210409 RepID=A0A5B7GMN2_PORTR|nr:hypothetical protein [Portunus trituberculatus]
MIREFDLRFTEVQFGFLLVDEYRPICLHNKVHLICLSAAHNLFQPLQSNVVVVVVRSGNGTSQHFAALNRRPKPPKISLALSLTLAKSVPLVAGSSSQFWPLCTYHVLSAAASPYSHCID